CRNSAPLGDEDVLEVLARATARSPVDVAAAAFDEREPRALEDLRIQIAAVVDHDHDRRAARKRTGCVGQRIAHAGDIAVDGSARRSALAGAELAAAPL